MVNFFLISNFDKQDKMQLLTKFKKKLYLGLRAILKSRKFKVALNLMYKICILSCLPNFDNKKKFTVPFLKYKCF